MSGLTGRLKKIVDSLMNSAGSASKIGTSRYHRAKRETVESLLAYVNNQVEQPAWPLEIFLEVSNICDLKCAMCPTFSPLNEKRFESLRADKRGLMDLQALKPHVDDLIGHALIVHAFGYGEPTIHPQFRDFLLFLAEYEVWIDFFTNGMHLNEEFGHFLVDKSIGRITVSFSGATREEYENVYIDGVFDKVLENLACLHRIKQQNKSPFPQVHVNSIAFEHHIRSLPEFVELMADHGVEAIHLKPLDTHDTIPQLHNHVSVYRENVEGKILAEAKRVAAHRGVHLASEPYERFCAQGAEDITLTRTKRHKGHNEVSSQEVAVMQLKELAREVTQAQKNDPAKAQRKPREKHLLEVEGETVSLAAAEMPCLEPFKTLYLALDGSIKPCCFANKSSPLGNIYDYTANGAWLNEPFSAVRSGVWADRYYTSLCGPCMKSSSYPKDLGLTMKLNQYSKLFKSRFGVPFHTHLIKQSRTLGQNRELINASSTEASGSKTGLA